MWREYETIKKSLIISCKDEVLVSVVVFYVFVELTMVMVTGGGDLMVVDGGGWMATGGGD